ncbi:FKBP-type peptidyl-prolyl cis-trans isomerase domain containing protein [Acidimicrobiia bacterium]
MGTSKRERQKIGHKARLTAEHAAQARYERRRKIGLGALAAAGTVVVIGLFVVLSDTTSTDTTAVTTSTTSTTFSPPSTQVPGASALGKDCVALADPLPAGAPAVPVPVGPPPTSLIIENLVTGTGTAVVATDTVTVNYIGVSCSTGKIFDSSWSRNEPATFPLDQVIPGWTQGLVGMQPGGERLLVIPPALGYGSNGQGSIAPDETLIFVVDLISVTPSPAKTTP